MRSRIRVLLVGCALAVLGLVSFAVRPGEVVAVLDPSGAGKTTLFRCLTGLTRPDAGSVVINGRDLTLASGRELRMARRDVALIFQQFNLIRRLTAFQNVLAGRLAQAQTWRLDPSSATVLESLRAAMAAGVAVIASLHQVHLARSFADRIIALRALLEDAPNASFDSRALEQLYERAGDRRRNTAATL